MLSALHCRPASHQRWRHSSVSQVQKQKPRNNQLILSDVDCGICAPGGKKSHSHSWETCSANLNSWLSLAGYNIRFLRQTNSSIEQRCAKKFPVKNYKHSRCKLRLKDDIRPALAVECFVEGIMALIFTILFPQKYILPSNFLAIERTPE